MKSLKILWVALIGLVFFNCSESDDGSYTEPIRLYEKVAGEWTLTNLRMIDNYALANAIEPSEQNIGTWFSFDTFQMNLHVDGTHSPTTYEVTGNSPELFPATGYWTLSNEFQLTTSSPNRINLYADAQHTQLMESLLLTSVPGSNAQMEVQLQRVSNGTPFLTYVFRLTTN